MRLQFRIMWMHHFGICLIVGAIFGLQIATQCTHNAAASVGRSHCLPLLT